MAESFIEQIYTYSRLISDIKSAIVETRKGRSIDASDCYNELYPQLCECCKELLCEEYADAKKLSREVLLLNEYKNDFMLLADRLEYNILPLLIDLVSSYSDINVDTGDGYMIRSSKVGYLTAQINITGKYIHSTYDPMEEARIYVENMYDPKYSEYVFYGCGMGYYIYQLFLISDGSTQIYVYEKDPQLVEYAKRYGVLEWVPNENLNIITSNNPGELFYEHIKKHPVGYYCHYAEVETVDDKKEKEILSSCCISYNTKNRMKDTAKLNLYRNLELGLKDVDSIKENIGDNVIIVAAGPSLDAGIGFLRTCNKRVTIIAVETVMRKLLDNGIKPDYVVVLDPSRRMIKHLRGVEKEKIPLIVDLCVYWRWTHDYSGDKYIVYSTFPCPEAVDYIEKEHKEKWPAGGTVTYLAMEFAIRKGAKNLCLLGVDLGYPEGKSHASGTAFEQSMDDYDTIWVESVDGGRIQTDYSMSLYRQAMEKRIDEADGGVKFYNLSSVGSRIKGTYEIDFAEAYNVFGIDN